MDIKKYTKCRPFLCLRRGVSCSLPRRRRLPCFSLPTQRCFTITTLSARLLMLFSAYAEVFPSSSRSIRPTNSFLCLRRGVSCRPLLLRGGRQLFSAYAEVFPEHFQREHSSSPFLCLRRGVSRALQLLLSLHVLFSAYAEVFPMLKVVSEEQLAFLCLRRGVSGRVCC